MTKNIIENKKFKDLMSSQIKQLIEFILKEDEEFSIVANINGITFTPELPKNVMKNMSKFSLFVLSNYTYSTIQLDDEKISFEAGFGNENFGSVVSIPYHRVFQIVKDDALLFINSVASIDNIQEDKTKKSMDIFKNNPKNKKFI